LRRILIVSGLIFTALYILGVRIGLSQKESPEIPTVQAGAGSLGDTQANFDEANRLMATPGASIADIEKAVGLYREVLTQWRRSNEPAGWAYAQMNLATAIATLDERGGGGGVAKLEEAVAGYRQALEVLTRERSPVDWANAQSALGLTLHSIGLRLKDKTRMTEAVATHRKALEALSSGTAARVGVMVNLCDSLAVFGEMTGETERLREAVTACGEIATSQIREAAPAMWAAAEANMANALTALGERAQGTVELEKALEAHHAALSEPAIDPAHAIVERQNLCITLSTLGEREKNVVRLEEAVAACRAAVEKAANGEVLDVTGGARDRLARAEALLAEQRKADAARRGKRLRK